MVSKVPVLYYSSFGHIEAMANAVAEGARPAGAHFDIKRHPKLCPRRSLPRRITSSIRMPSAEDRFFVLPARSQG